MMFIDFWKKLTFVKKGISRAVKSHQFSPPLCSNVVFQQCIFTAMEIQNVHPDLLCSSQKPPIFALFTQNQQWLTQKNFKLGLWGDAHFPRPFLYIYAKPRFSSMKRMRTYSSCTERVFRVLFPVLTKHTIEAPTDTGVSGNLVLFRTPLTRHYFMVTYLYLVF